MRTSHFSGTCSILCNFGWRLYTYILTSLYAEIVLNAFRYLHIFLLVFPIKGSLAPVAFLPSFVREKLLLVRFQVLQSFCTCGLLLTRLMFSKIGQALDTRVAEHVSKESTLASYYN